MSTQPRPFDLSPKRRAVLDALLSGAGVEQTPRIERRTDPVAPLSFAQERMWFLDQLEAGNPAYNVPVAVRLPMAVDAGALERSINEVVRRHEALRTTFEVVEGSPVQVVAPALEVSLSVRDLRGLSEEAGEAEALRLAAAEAQQPFDLARGPLLRAVLVRRGDAEHLLLLTLHHIVSDAWSMGVLFKELTTLYDAYCLGRSSPLPELSVQYPDFAAWQRRWLAGPVLDQHLAYWRHQLDGAPALLELPTDRPRPAVQRYRGAVHPFVVPAPVAEALKSLSQRQGVTLFMTLLAGFCTVLHRYSAQEDMVVGSPIANRTRPELEGLIGFFLNTLALRVDLSGDPTVGELLGRVREVTLQAYAHQDLPFEKLVEELQPKRSLSYNPLFQVMFTLQNAFSPHNGSAASSGTGASSAPTDTPPLISTGTAKFDLGLLMQETDQGLVAVLEYSTDLFDAVTAARFAGHLQRLLGAFAQDAERRLSELELLTDDERRQLGAWNATARDYPADRCVHQLFEAQVRRTPQNLAVVFGEDQLSYEALNLRANRLAHHLQALGVGPDVVVGICLERSTEMVVALLGVLKAGGAYLPLDPAYPLERLGFMLADAGAPVLVTSTGLGDRLPDTAATVVRLDREASAIAQRPGTDPDSDVRPDHLAYVIYTSGSTGVPKGVAMSHRPLSNLLTWQIAQAAFTPGGTTLQFAAVGFDVSFQEIFATWCSGGALVLTTDEDRRDAAQVLRLLSERAVNRLFVPFVGLQQIADSARFRNALPGALGLVVTAGEQLRVTPAVVDFFTSLSRASLRNQYGPSETHVASEFALSGDARNWPALPPIGRPIANTRIYLLDRWLNPVPVGVPGEIHIAGVGLARGYLNQPALTAERFLPDLFGPEPGGRMYRTGDLGRYRLDGDIEFLGRLDHQVKVRGFRVELGEVESVLSQQPGVRQAAVSTWDDGHGERRLVAYVVAEPGVVTTASELRRFLVARLPEHLIPSAFVALDTLPLSPNGKVDRRALPDPDPTRPELEAAFVAPRTPLEAAIARIWSEVLGIDSIGVHDNFFELGGHSLLATQVVSRIAETFHLDLPLRTIFETPTVAQLAVSVVEGECALVGEPAIRLLDEVEQLSNEQARAASSTSATRTAGGTRT